jgi:hypothetical protein
MKITITSTDQITRLDDVEVRVWEGTTEDGVACKVFVHRLAVLVRADADVERFERELAEKLPPGRSVPLSMIL